MPDHKSFDCKNVSIGSVHVLSDRKSDFIGVIFECLPIQRFLIGSNELQESLPNALSTLNCCQTLEPPCTAAHVRRFQPVDQSAAVMKVIYAKAKLSMPDEVLGKVQV